MMKKLLNGKHENTLMFTYFIVLCTIIYGRLWVMDFQPPKFQEGDNPAAFINSSSLRFLNYSHIYGLNLWILFLPDWLCFDWSMGCLSYVRDTNISTLLQPQSIKKLLFGLFFRCFIICFVVIELAYPLLLSLKPRFSYHCNVNFH